MNKDKKLDELISLIVSYEQTHCILLFGSRACGKACAEGDYDICVLYDTLKKRKLKVLQDLYRTLFPFKGHPIDLVVYEVATFAQKALEKGSFEARISAEAKLIYGTHETSLVLKVPHYEQFIERGEL